LSGNIHYAVGAIVRRKRRDLKDYKFQLRKDDGSLVDITSATVKFFMAEESEVITAGKDADISSITLTINATMTIDDGPTGVVKYTPEAAEVDEAGIYLAEIEVTNGAVVETYPEEGYIRVVVDKDLG